jgi:hypothetical protein
MHDGANEPAAVPVPSREVTGPAAGRRIALLLGIGGGVGLALGILLTLGVFATYTFFTHTLPETRDSVQVFNELNELRQQLNQLNEDKKHKEQEKEEAMRQALSAVASTVRPPDSQLNEEQKPKEQDKEEAMRQALSAVASVTGAPGVLAPAKKQGEGAEGPPVMKRQDPFADIDEEIERLEQTQKVLNTILDLFTKKKERAKDR